MRLLLIFSIYVLIVLLVIIAIVLIERGLLTVEEDAASVHMWMQCVTGTWPIGWENIDRKSLRFSIFVTIRILFIIAPICALGAIFWKLYDLVMIGDAMRYADLIRMRDALLVNELSGQEEPKKREALEKRLVEACKKVDKKFYASIDTLTRGQGAKVKAALHKPLDI